MLKDQKLVKQSLANPFQGFNLLMKAIDRIEYEEASEAQEQAMAI